MDEAVDDEEPLSDDEEVDEEVDAELVAGVEEDEPARLSVR